MWSLKSEFLKDDKEIFISKENGEIKDKMELENKIDDLEFET